MGAVFSLRQDGRSGSGDGLWLTVLTIDGLIAVRIIGSIVADILGIIASDFDLLYHIYEPIIGSFPPIYRPPAQSSVPFGKVPSPAPQMLSWSRMGEDG